MMGPRLILAVAGLAAITTAQAADLMTPYADPHTARALMRQGMEQPLTHTGKVAEVQVTSNYVYLRVAQPEGHIWLAAPRQTVAVGAQVSWGEGVEMQDYKSQQLDRFFHKVVFVDRIGIGEVK